MASEVTERVASFVRELENQSKKAEGYRPEHLECQLLKAGMIVALIDPGRASEVLERLEGEGTTGPLLPANFLGILLDG